MAKLNVKVALQLKHALIAFGVKEPQLGYLMAQAAYETAGFEKLPALLDNNLAGIKYNSALKNIANASSNFSAPPSEGPNGHYAHFVSINDFIRGWILYAHLKNKRPGNNIGTPWDASNLVDYGHRLKLNHYYQDPEFKYQNGLKAWDARLQKMPEKSMALSNTVASIDMVKYSKNTIPYYMGIDTVKGKNPVSKINSASLATHSFINAAKQVRAWDANLNVLQTRKTPAKTFSKPIDNLPANNNAKPLPTKKNINQRINGIQNENRYKSIFDIPNFVNTFSSAFPSPLSEAGNLAAVSNPGNAAKHQPLAAIYKKYEASPLLNSSILNYSTEGNENNTLGLPSLPGAAIADGKPNKNPAKIPTTGSSAVSINLNNPLIGNFTINVKDVKEGIKDFKHKVEEVLMEILNSANAI